jgi:hypothetical protein
VAGDRPNLLLAAEPERNYLLMKAVRVRDAIR